MDSYCHSFLSLPKKFSTINELGSAEDGTAFDIIGILRVMLTGPMRQLDAMGYRLLDPRQWQKVYRVHGERL